MANPQPAAPGRAFVITRTFDAPRDLVWKAWTEAERLTEWWGPTGFDIHVAKLDLRPGGTFHYRMRPTKGDDMWGKFTFIEVAPPERLVFLNSFSDPEGRTTRAPFAETWPLNMHSTITFEAQGDRTTVTIHWVPFEATEEERATFEAGFDSMTQGWGGTLDKLAGYLARAGAGEAE